MRHVWSQNSTLGTVRRTCVYSVSRFVRLHAQSIPFAVRILFGALDSVMHSGRFQLAVKCCWQRDRCTLSYYRPEQALGGIQLRAPGMQLGLQACLPAIPEKLQLSSLVPNLSRNTEMIATDSQHM